MPYNKDYSSSWNNNIYVHDTIKLQTQLKKQYKDKNVIKMMYSRNELDAAIRYMKNL